MASAPASRSSARRGRGVILTCNSNRDAAETVVSAIEAAKQLLGESGRLVIRPSGTEPVIRVMAEGDDRDLVMRAVDDVVEAVTRAAA